jgi:hypothetical protein
MNKTSIGILLPTSSILPMAKCYTDAFKAGITSVVKDDNIEIVTEFTATASKDLMNKSIDKLLNFDGVDVVTGIVTNRMAAFFADIFARRDSLLLASNLGEHLPPASDLGTNVVIHSSCLWQEIASLSFWAVNQFGKKGMMVCSLYEAGYPFMYMMELGMKAASADATMPFAVAQLGANGKTCDPKNVIPYIQEFAPDFVFAFFCGEEASMFNKEYVSSGLHQRIPLLGNAYMFEHFDASGEQLSIYSTEISPDTSLDVLDKNHKRKHIEALAFDTGLLLGKGIESQGSDTLAQSIHRIKQTSNFISDASQQKLDVVKNTFLPTNNSWKKQVIQKDIKHTIPADMLKEMPYTTSGWMNPYLAI